MQGARWRCAGRGARSNALEVPPREEQHGHCLHAMGEHLLAPDTPRYCLILPTQFCQVFPRGSRRLWTRNQGLAACSTATLMLVLAGHNLCPLMPQHARHPAAAAGTLVLCPSSPWLCPTARLVLRGGCQQPPSAGTLDVCMRAVRALPWGCTALPSAAGGEEGQGRSGADDDLAQLVNLQVSLQCTWLLDSLL